MDPRTALFLLWMWHAAWVAMLTYSIGRAAWRHSGRPRWPITGRWLLTFMLAEFAVIFADVARRSYENRNSLGALEVSWGTVALRALPALLAPLVFWRQWTRGLLNDPD